MRPQLPILLAGVLLGACPNKTPPPEPQQKPASEAPASAPAQEPAPAPAAAEPEEPEEPEEPAKKNKACVDQCLQQNSMRAVGWEVIKAECERTCSMKPAP